MNENIKNFNINRSIFYYLTEYLILLGSAIAVVGLTVGSHKIGIPLYKINPMHWVMYLIIVNRKPGLLSISMLAILLPMLSTAFTGHPIMIKSIISIL